MRRRNRKDNITLCNENYQPVLASGPWLVHPSLGLHHYLAGRASWVVLQSPSVQRAGHCLFVSVQRLQWAREIPYQAADYKLQFSPWYEKMFITNIKINNKIMSFKTIENIPSKILLVNSFIYKYFIRAWKYLKGKFPQTTMWIGWVECNFTNPTVKVWTDNG